MGEAFYGNALRVAKDIPGITAQDRSVLDRWATGGQSGTDHIGLQEIAMKVRDSELDVGLIEVPEAESDRQEGSAERERGF